MSRKRFSKVLALTLVFVMVMSSVASAATGDYTTISNTLRANITVNEATVKKVQNQETGAWYPTIQEAIAGAGSNETLKVNAGTYVEVGQIIINKNLTIVGADKETTIIKPAGNTGSSGDERGWILVEAGNEFNLSNVTLDGAEKQIYGAIRSHGTGTIDNNIIMNMEYSKYFGFGVVAMGNMTVSNNTFTNIERVGTSVFGTTATAVVVSGNNYTGKGGEVDGIDNAIEVGGGANATITGNTIKDCLGTASSDGSGSVGVLVTSYYGGISKATITGNIISDNTVGVHVGYGDVDINEVTVANNTFNNNKSHVYGKSVSGINMVDTLEDNTFTGDKAVVIDNDTIIDVEGDFIAMTWGENVTNIDGVAQFTTEIGQSFDVSVKAALGTVGTVDDLENITAVDRVLYIIKVTNGDGTTNVTADTLTAVADESIAYLENGMWHWGPSTGFTAEVADSEAQFSVTFNEMGTFNAEIYAVRVSK